MNLSSNYGRRREISAHTEFINFIDGLSELDSLEYNCCFVSVTRKLRKMDPAIFVYKSGDVLKSISSMKGYSLVKGKKNYLSQFIDLDEEIVNINFGDAGDGLGFSLVLQQVDKSVQLFTESAIEAIYIKEFLTKFINRNLLGNSDYINISNKRKKDILNNDDYEGRKRQNKMKINGDSKGVSKSVKTEVEQRANYLHRKLMGVNGNSPGSKRENSKSPLKKTVRTNSKGKRLSPSKNIRRGDDRSQSRSVQGDNNISFGIENESNQNQKITKKNINTSPTAQRAKPKITANQNLNSRNKIQDPNVRSEKKLDLLNLQSAQKPKREIKEKKQISKENNINIISKRNDEYQFTNNSYNPNSYKAPLHPPSTKIPKLSLYQNKAELYQNLKSKKNNQSIEQALGLRVNPNEGLPANLKKFLNVIFYKLVSNGYNFSTRTSRFWNRTFLPFRKFTKRFFRTFGKMETWAKMVSSN